MPETKSAASPRKPGTVSKIAAVEQSLQTLGNSATPTQLQKHIREQYKIEMGLKHISTAKNKILKAAAASKPANTETTATKPPAKQSATPRTGSSTAGPRTVTAPDGKTRGISLEDIETVKDLVERVGANSLKKLIDVMAR